MRDDTNPSGWVIGGVFFAGVLMVIAGAFQFINGLAAIGKDKIYAATPDYVFEFDVTTWGWIHLIIGVIVALAGIAAMNGATWARVVGIVLAGISAITNFMFIPFYPFWSLAVIALAIWIIWALCDERAGTRSRY
jgi:hypothetical protein